MMKKNSSGESKTSNPRSFGATPVGLSEDDAARMVGGIVEKGFSDDLQLRSFVPSSVPRPTVLPFPVARHRSHGPHWTPLAGNDDVEDDDDREEEGHDGMEFIAAVANPVQRKEKKGLDFSQWHDMVKNEANSAAHEKKKERRQSPMLEVGHKSQENPKRKLSRQIVEPEVAKLCGTSCASSKEIQDNSKMDLRQNSYEVSGFGSEKLVLGEGGDLKSQIDSENLARLANMSSEDIAEAQAEIMTKLNPELIKALKKRGQEKAKKPQLSSSDTTGSEAQKKQSEKNTPTISSTDQSTSHSPVQTVPVDTLKKNDTPNIYPLKFSTWDAWSERVERVRDMRFSLDGDIVSSDSIPVSDIGDGSSQSAYNAKNVAERDFLRTEGDPGAAGYTIKEAVALARSVVPGQRTLALHLIAAILDRAICNICRNQVDSEGSADWEAIWAFALGPEPELALSLRMSLDDNHNSVVLACAKAILCALSCDKNEIIFDIAEKIPNYATGICTAPVFRSKPDVKNGFLRGGFWKYNTKPSNILLSGEPVEDKAEDEHTIQDDVVVAGQDFAAGIVRMGILPRICYLLEMDPSAPLDECLISILIAISRHSPTCAAAVMDCEKLVQTIANRFSSTEQPGINTSKIKSVVLLKVLAQHEKKNCFKFVKNGILRQVTWHLYRYLLSIDQWLKSGREACKLSSALLVEQLRLWKVVNRYGYCNSDISGLFASMGIWLSVPNIEKLIDHDVMDDYCAISREVYVLLGDFVHTFPNFYSWTHERTEDAAQDRETFSWNQFSSVIDHALEWIALKSNPHLSRLFGCQNNNAEHRSLQDSEVCSFLWVISSVLNVLSSALKAMIPDDTMDLPNGHFPWLPDFVPRIGLEIIKNGYFRFLGVSDHRSENESILHYLCNLRHKGGHELAISSTCCLQGLTGVVSLVDTLVQNANLEVHNPRFKLPHLSKEDKVLANGILKSCNVDVEDLLTNIISSIANEWKNMCSIEMFGRGGPAPGVGVGWGASHGGYWSLQTLLAQQDARLFIYLLEITELPLVNDQFEPGKIGNVMRRINCALAACSVLCPGNGPVIDRILNVIFQVPVLKYLDFGIHQFISHRKGYSPLGWNYKEEDFQFFADVLVTHFRSRWLNVKKKKQQQQTVKGENNRFSHQSSKNLEPIHEDMDIDALCKETPSLKLEWINQRLPLPIHWFLSAISTVQIEKNLHSPDKETYIEVSSDFLETAKAGLFFLLGVEAIPTFLGSEFCCSPVEHVPVVMKLHAMSVMLLCGMSVLEDEKSREVYETLQNVYGEKLSDLGKSLQFMSDIHENYTTFIEMLVDQFAAESYGDLLFGRQVAVYLHRLVEPSVRLSTWNALSNARALDLLPPLPKCFAQAKGYLEPIEENERILEAYVKSWVSGALDKAVTRNSMAFAVVVHHLSSFIFGDTGPITLRNKLAKSLFRDYCCKQQHEGMMVKLICYKGPEIGSLQSSSLVQERLELLTRVCDGNASSMQKLQRCCQAKK